MNDANQEAVAGRVPSGPVEALVEARLHETLVRLAGRLRDRPYDTGGPHRDIGEPGAGEGAVVRDTSLEGGSEVRASDLGEPYPPMRLPSSEVRESAAAEAADNKPDYGSSQSALLVEVVLREIGRALLEIASRDEGVAGKSIAGEGVAGERAETRERQTSAKSQSVRGPNEPGSRAETSTPVSPGNTVTSARVVFGGAVVPASTRVPANTVELLEQSVTAKKAADLLGVNPSRIRQRLAERSLFGFKHGGSWHLPSCQLEHGRPIPGIERAFAALPSDISPLAVVRWFLTPWADLVLDEATETVVSPRDWLLQGRDPAPVAAQAMLL